LLPTARRFGGKMAAMRVFISYRRDDSMVTAALLYKELVGRADFADAFMDIDDIGYGDDFVAAIDSALHDAAVVVVVIGPRWTEMVQARLRGDDWVRHEVATALRLRTPGGAAGRAALRVLPVLIGSATPPAESALPADLAPLARLGMLKFDERSLKASLNSLLEAIQEEDFEGKVRRLQEERRQLEEERLRLERERTRRRRARIATIGAAFALFLAASVGLLDVFNLDTRIASATMLLARVAAPAPKWSDDVVLVGIDEATERAIGRSFDASWRAEHAALIGHAASAAARTVAFDMVLEDPGVEAANAALQAALAATREKMPVVFGVQSLGAEGKGAMLAPFSALARQGINCAGLALGNARSMPLAIDRKGVGADGAAASASAGSAALVAAQPPAAPMPSFALAAYSGGGRVELIDAAAQTVTVRLRPQRRSQVIDYYEDKTLGDTEIGCNVLRKGDRVVSQLIDPYDLPPLDKPPQRIAYERLVAGDPAALALLKDRIVLVGVLLPERPGRPDSDLIPMPWPARDRWGAELIAAQIDAMARDVTIRAMDPLAQWALISGLALLGAYCAHRLRERPRVLRIAALAAIALLWVAASIVWYRTYRQLIGVPYGIVALALGAWLANRNWTRSST
jgi:CHASE2 domain-containing sensor protein